MAYSPVMPPQLMALTEGPDILLDKPIVLIGRHQECDIQIPSRKVSRRHCCLAQINGHLVVRDLCSTNGVRINGVRVQEGNLNPGDELMIGSYKYQVSWPSQSPAPAPAAVGRPELPQLAPVEEMNGLDSCEEPMPIPEPDRNGVKANSPPLPAANGSVDMHAKASAPAQLSEAPPIGIPEDLPLQPLVDSKIVPPVSLG